LNAGDCDSVFHEAADDHSRLCSVTLWHAVIHHDQLVHGSVERRTAIQDQVDSLLPVIRSIALEVELQEEAHQGNDVKRVVIDYEHFVFL